MCGFSIRACHIGSSVVPTGDKEMRVTRTPSTFIQGDACRRQAPQKGTLLWLLSWEGIRKCRKMVERCSRAWHLSPQEVYYANHRFYEFVADYHFAVATQEFLLGPWPLEPLKSMPGEAAIGSPCVVRILSGQSRCPRGVAAKRDLETFQREHIELMQNHLKERRSILFDLLHPPQAPMCRSRSSHPDWTGYSTLPSWSSSHQHEGVRLNRQQR